MAHGKSITLWLVATAVAHTVIATELPTDFRHDRIFLVPETKTGEQIEFYTDTGGGWNMIREPLAARLGLEQIGTLEARDREMKLVRFPDFQDRRSVPAPGDENFNDGGLVAVPDDDSEGPHLSDGGFLGAHWFANRVWEFDYPGRALRLLDERARPEPGAKGTVSLGFQTDESGERTTHFPRITVYVDGEPLEMLFDTGATVTLSATVAEHFDVKAGAQIGGSFISSAVFERWQKAHPEWLVIEKADRIRDLVMPMIRVPKITIAGHTVGPVWFAARPEGNFEEWMSGMMDEPIVGALGGSGLRYFRIVVDYPRAVAQFHRK